jgi:peptidyl-prolyl cis-trans isomerase-like 2
MIQTGDPTGTGRGGKSYFGEPFEDECKASISRTFNISSLPYKKILLK